MRIFQRPSKDPFKDPIEIFASSLRIWLESYNDPSQDLCKIFSKILQDPQGFKEDLLKTFKESFKGYLSRVLLRSLLRYFRIRSGSYKDPSQNLCKIYSTILQDPQGIKKDLLKTLKRFISWSCRDLCKDPFGIWCGSQGHPSQDLYHISAFWIRFLQYILIK